METKTTKAQDLSTLTDRQVAIRYGIALSAYVRADFYGRPTETARETYRALFAERVRRGHRGFARQEVRS